MTLVAFGRSSFLALQVFQVPENVKVHVICSKHEVSLPQGLQTTSSPQVNECYSTHYSVNKAFYKTMHTVYNQETVHTLGIRPGPDSARVGLIWDSDDSGLRFSVVTNIISVSNTSSIPI